MMESGGKERLFGLFLLLYFPALFLLSLTTPLSPSEAEIFFEFPHTPVAWAARLLEPWLPGTLGLRLLPFALGVLNAWLYWKLIDGYFDREGDRRFAYFLYLMLPGVIASGVLLNEATYALTMVLFFLLAHRKGSRWMQLLALALLFPSPTATFAFYASIAFYGYRKKERFLLVSGLLFLVAALIWGSYDLGGRPQGHFLELLGIYAALFSPLYFIYYFYSLYRVSLEGPRDLYWTIASGALLISILLSIRQQVLITDFSAYLLAGAMIPPAVYLRSLRVRMRRFQRGYRIAAGVVLATLVASSLVLILHRPIYRLLGSPKGYFAAALYEPYDLVEKLRREGRHCAPSIKEKYRPILRFYGYIVCSGE